jgi:hypothetical protein
MTRMAAIFIVSAVALFAPFATAADPTTADCLTASNASIRLRKDHHLRDAREQLLVCATMTCPAEVRDECERRLVAVNAAIPTIVFVAKDAAGNDLSSVTVRMDGKPLLDSLDGTPSSLDPGAHSFAFETAGQAPVIKAFVVQEGEKDRRERIVFGAAVATDAPPVSVTANASTGMSTPRVLGLLSGGVGLAAIGVGAAFAVLANAANTSQQTDCASPTNCQNYTQAASDHATFTTDTSVEVAGFVAGGALLIAGVVLFVVGGKADPAKTGLVLLPSFAPNGAGLTLHGGF